ncbi:MAG: FlgD immunoglobulin-like domain containing protein, partial [bacterium]
PGGDMWVFNYPFEPTSVTPEETNSPIPKSFLLSQNYPNPFNPSTTMDYTIPEGDAVAVHLNIYDLRGRLVRALVDEDKQPGRYTVRWDGRDDQGKVVSSGLYFYRVEVGGFRSTKKMMLVR